MDEIPLHVFENEAWKNKFFKATKQIITALNKNKLQTLEAMSKEDLKSNSIFTPQSYQFFEIIYDTETIQQLYPVTVPESISRPGFFWTASELLEYGKMSRLERYNTLMFIFEKKLTNFKLLKQDILSLYWFLSSFYEELTIKLEVTQPERDMKKAFEDKLWAYLMEAGKR